ncbi:MAG: HAD family hydrolase [Hyphomicrobium sp.]|jgi:HAD superfamily hydrolase (TIGR01549 family)
MPFSSIRAVAFDAFDTLIYTAEPQRPLDGLIRWLRQTKPAPRIDDACWLMSREFNLNALAADLPSPVRHDLEQRLEREIASITAFEDAQSTLMALKTRGYQLAICSNLIEPHAPAALRALPIAWDAAVWSFEIAATKPSPAFYAAVADRLQLPPQQILFVGDHIVNDVTAPRKAGMQALYLRRGYASCVPGREISSLTDLPKLLAP